MAWCYTSRGMPTLQNMWRTAWTTRTVDQWWLLMMTRHTQYVYVRVRTRGKVNGWMVGRSGLEDVVGERGNRGVHRKQQQETVLEAWNFKEGTTSGEVRRYRMGWDDALCDELCDNYRREIKVKLKRRVAQTQGFFSRHINCKIVLLNKTHHKNIDIKIPRYSSLIES